MAARVGEALNGLQRENTVSRGPQLIHHHIVVSLFLNAVVNNHSLAVIDPIETLSSGDSKAGMRSPRTSRLPPRHRRRHVFAARSRYGPFAETR